MLILKQKTSLNWHKVSGLIPVIVQHTESGEVLMLGYMNNEALNITLTTKKATFYSRTKKRLWVKGETSGNFLHVTDISSDCDNDSLLLLALPDGPTCHKGTNSCFTPLTTESIFIYQLEQVLEERKHADPHTSYTANLYAQGCKRIAQKVGEEAVETALSAVTGDKTELLNEAADLLFHLLVLLKNNQLKFNQIIKILKKRHQRK